jgi:hypothetical protein
MSSSLGYFMTLREMSLQRDRTLWEFELCEFEITCNKNINKASLYVQSFKKC